MLDITTELKDLYKTDYLPYRAEPVQKDLKFTFTDPELIIENDKVVAGSFELQESLNSSDDLEFGSCESSCLKVKFADVTDNIQGKTFVLTQTIDEEVVNLGVFTVDSAIEEEGLRFLSVIAYDNMRMFDIDVWSWYDNLTFPITVKNMRISLCTYCGVEYTDSNLPNDSMNVTKNVSAETLNGLDVLKKLEQINGAFGHIGRDGKLQHIVLSQSNVNDTIPNTSYRKLKFEKYTTQAISKVQIHQEDGDIGAIRGSGSNCYKITDNFLVYGKTAVTLQTIVNNLAPNIIGISYVPYTCEMIGLPYLEVGDRVTFGDGITSYILTRNLKGIQSLKDDIETKGNEKITQEVSVNTEIKQLRGKSNVLTRNVETLSSEVSEFDKKVTVLLPGEWYPDGSLLPCKNDITNLEYEVRTKIIQTAREITTEVNNVSDQLSSQITQTSTEINTQVSNLTANMNTQFIQTSESISTKVDKNGIISEINQSAESITINASKINLSGYVTATDLEAGNLTVTGSCIVGNLYGVNISGSTISSVGNLGKVTIDGGGLRYNRGQFDVTMEYGQLMVSDLYNGGQVQIAPYAIYINGDPVLTNASTINTSNVNASLYSSSTYPGTYYMEFSNTSGDTNIPTIGWVKARSSSDKRLKKNIKNLVDIEDEYMKLQPVSYKFKKHVNDDNLHYGFVAQDVKKQFPNCNLVEYDKEIVTEGERKYIKNDGVYRLNYQEFNALHVAMIQKQQKEIDVLRKELSVCKESIQQYLN